MGALSEMTRRARRTALICELVETFDRPDERKNTVMRLWEANIISPQTAELLIEHFSLEAA
jgi:hypothetical protein